MSAGSKFGFYIAVGMLLALLIGCQPSGRLTDGTAGSDEAGAANVHAAATTGGAPAADAPAGGTVPVVMAVSGMSCPLCAHNIDQQLHKIPGVQKVTINLGTGDVTALVTRGAPLRREQFAHAIEQSGFTLKNVRMPADDAAVACAACTCDKSACKCAPAGGKCGDACRCRA